MLELTCTGGAPRLPALSSSPSDDDERWCSGAAAMERESRLAAASDWLMVLTDGRKERFLY
jgi:hypothetical protein